LQNNKQLLKFFNSNEIFLEPFKEIFSIHNRDVEFEISADFLNDISLKFFSNRTSVDAFRFIEQKKKEKDFYKKYDALVFNEKKIPIRKNIVHDYFNAITWLAFPNAKKKLNKKNFIFLENNYLNGNKNRPRNIDLTTLLDESGIIVVTKNSYLASLMEKKKWKTVFWDNRDIVKKSFRFFLFGHSLFEKLMNKYIGTAARALIISDESLLLDKITINNVDQMLSDYIDRDSFFKNLEKSISIPLFAIPGWSNLNEKEEFYQGNEYLR
jgi:hypothetical protein